MLTFAAVRDARGREKPYKLYDERGLYLIVNPNGKRYWRFKYRYDAREKTISMGVFPDVSSRAAREKRDEARRLLAEQGIDPSAKRKADKLARDLVNADTFRAVAEEWLLAGCPGSRRVEHRYWPKVERRRVRFGSEKDSFQGS